MSKTNIRLFWLYHRRGVNSYIFIYVNENLIPNVALDHEIKLDIQQFKRLIVFQIKESRKA